MRSTMRLAAVAAISFHCASAQAAVQGGNAAADKDRNPNQIVCEKQTVIGSRLATKNKCLTRAQWAEHRKVTKETMDGMQRPGASVCIPRPGISKC